MTGAPSITLAFAAGLVSFLSPCCLPLVPGYVVAGAAFAIAWTPCVGPALGAILGLAATLFMGVLVLTGELFRLNIEVQQLLDRYGLNFFRSV